MITISFRVAALLALLGVISLGLNLYQSERRRRQRDKEQALTQHVRALLETTDRLAIACSKSRVSLEEAGRHVQQMSAQTRAILNVLTEKEEFEFWVSPELH